MMKHVLIILNLLVVPLIALYFLGLYLAWCSDYLLQKVAQKRLTKEEKKKYKELYPEVSQVLILYIKSLPLLFTPRYKEIYNKYKEFIHYLLLSYLLYILTITVFYYYMLSTKVVFLWLVYPFLVFFFSYYYDDIVSITQKKAESIDIKSDGDITKQIVQHATNIDTIIRQILNKHKTMQ